MKYLLIASCSVMENHLIRELIKDGHEVSVLLPDSAATHISKIRHAQYFFYENLDFSIFFSSIMPDFVIFSNLYKETGESAMILRETLKNCHSHSVRHFLLCSSVDVYGMETGVVCESSPCHPRGATGIEASQAEHFVDLSQEIFDQVLIARLPSVDTASALEQIIEVVKEREEIRVSSLQKLQLLSARDQARAVARLANSSLNGIYNVASRKKVSKIELYQSICKQKKLGCHILPDNLAIDSLWIDSSLLFEETEFIELEDPLTVLETIKTDIQDTPVFLAKNKNNMPASVRKTIEVLILGSAAWGLSLVCTANPVFSQIQWLMLYTVGIALVYGIRYATLAASLSSLVSLLLSGSNPFEVEDFYLLAGDILVIAQYLTIGLMVSYFVTVLRQKINLLHKKKQDLSIRLEEVQTVNQENIRIKESYEKQILGAQTGYAALYAQFHTLASANSQSDLYKLTLSVAKKFFNCSAAAIYPLTPLLRPGKCICTSDDSLSVIKLSNKAQFSACMKSHEVYLGDPFAGEPSYALPICGLKGIESVLFLQDPQFEGTNLQTISNMNTFAAMLSDLYKIQERSSADNLAAYIHLKNPEYQMAHSVQTGTFYKTPEAQNGVDVYYNPNSVISENFYAQNSKKISDIDLNSFHKGGKGL